jgi:hypothetical protein
LTNARVAQVARAAVRLAHPVDVLRSGLDGQRRTPQGTSERNSRRLTVDQALIALLIVARFRRATGCRHSPPT